MFVSYDFENNHQRASFAKFLKKFGRKIQYSVYEIKNSKRILQNILSEIELKYKKNFSGADSIIVFYICESCQKKIKRYGHSKNEEEDIVLFK